MKDSKNYGMEIIVDLHDCDIKRFTKKSLDEFFLKICELSDMTAVGKPKYWHELSNIPHLKGYSGIQFIKTSNILIHTLDITKDAYINFFSCKEFDVDQIIGFITEHFQAERVFHKLVYRGENK